MLNYTQLNRNINLKDTTMCDKIYRDAKPLNINEIDKCEWDSLVWESKKLKGRSLGIILPNIDNNEDNDHLIEVIYDELDRLIVEPEQFVYETCNYKGEGLGYVYASLAENLPIYS